MDYICELPSVDWEEAEVEMGLGMPEHWRICLPESESANQIV